MQGSLQELSSAAVSGVTPKTLLWAVGALRAGTMLPRTGGCPAPSSAPAQSDTGWEWGSPRGPNPFLEAGECHEWPDLCVATDNCGSFIICQADGPDRASQNVPDSSSQPINLSSTR